MDVNQQTPEDQRRTVVQDIVRIPMMDEVSNARVFRPADTGRVVRVIQNVEFPEPDNFTGIK